VNSEGNVLIAVLMPHAPVLVPGVAGARVRAAGESVDAMSAVARRVVDVRPDALVLITPHAPRRGSGFALRWGARVRGNLLDFGAPNLGVDLPSAGGLAQAIEQATMARGLGVARWSDTPLDHGAVVPLWHLAQAGWDGPTVVVGLHESESADPVELGLAIAEATLREELSVAVVASGDMSHRLQQGAPSGFHPRAVEFDRALIECLGTGDLRGLLHLDPDLQALAAEDAVDSALVAASAVGWDDHGHRVLSYQGPFGVGYGVAILHDALADMDVAGKGGRRVGTRMVFVDPSGAALPGIARRSVEAAFRGNGGGPVLKHSGIAAERHAVFVTIRHADGDLRGCVGDLRPRCVNVAMETWQLARDAAFRDHRFSPVTADELPGLSFEVSVLSPLEEVASTAALDPERYGVVVESDDGRRGALLPGIDGLDTVEEQLSMVRRKGGMTATEPVRLWRFTVNKFREATNRERPVA
jgi:AmmeMemoRadiSam system protein A